jgi:hypothetical protein
MREEITIQLVLLLFMFLLGGLWIFMNLPRWKKEMLVKTAMDQILDVKEVASNYLSGREELLVQEFKRLVSEWDHEQLQKFRGKINDRLQKLSESESPGEAKGDSTEESH